ncbi:hypothetical protein PCH_Pc21g08540 [Penicillium rubens Wisconsin 54-1255]|uniref:Uncharacterized protein n=2 Tax=Penicillium rubens TaxID=1108849 RepID=B6HLZ6_PENRW|nr:hypothetical protein N7534_011074 [Penicillium rubens]CAP95751.1 hypothetical protein PCH_Pc21g08540 [Penicillium rubens Wisconsin 54-1255]
MLGGYKRHTATQGHLIFQNDIDRDATDFRYRRKARGKTQLPFRFQQLRLELCATDPLYWPTIMGVNEGPVEPKPVLYPQQAISAIPKSKGIAPSQVTDQEVEGFFDEVIERNKLLPPK